MQQTRINKFGLFLAVALFFYVLNATKFFPIFYASLQQNYDTYLENTNEAALLMDFAFTHKFDGLEQHLLRSVVGISVSSVETTALSPEKEDFSNMISSEPLVYIYNTHNTETIAGVETAPGVADPGDVSIMELSRLMGQAFEAKGIPVIVEGRDTQSIVEERGWHYSRSYDVSREILKSSWDANPSLAYFIDIHRDATTGADATIKLDGREYAVLQLVVGSDNPAFAENLAFVNEIISKLEARYPGLLGSNAVRLMGGPGKNGIYNQDLSSTAILVEVGGQDTSLEAARNSIEALVSVLADLIYG